MSCDQRWSPLFWLLGYGMGLVLLRQVGELSSIWLWRLTDFWGEGEGPWARTGAGADITETKENAVSEVHWESIRLKLQMMLNPQD